MEPFILTDGTEISCSTIALEFSLDEIKRYYYIYSKKVRGFEMSESELAEMAALESLAQPKLTISKNEATIDITIAHDECDPFVMFVANLLGTHFKLQNRDFVSYMASSGLISEVPPEYIHQVDQELYELEMAG